VSWPLLPPFFESLLTRDTSFSMVLIPCLLLAFFSPGILFSQMAARMSAPGRIGPGHKDGNKSDPEKQSQPEGHESSPSEVQAKETPTSASAAV
jgi:hypothetical protein